MKMFSVMKFNLLSLCFVKRVFSEMQFACFNAKQCKVGGNLSNFIVDIAL